MLLFFFENFYLYNFQRLSLNTLIMWLHYYTQTSYIYYFLILLLSGLPPVALFFIKLQIILQCIVFWDIFLLLSIFLIFFINMLFYLQFFKVKPHWLYLFEIFTTFKLNSKILNNKVLKFNGKLYYKLKFIIHGLIFFSIFSIFWAQDIFLIIFALV